MSQSPIPGSADDLLALEEVLAFFGGAAKPIHHTTLYRGIQAGKYPEGVYIGPRTVRWRRRECEAAREKIIEEGRLIAAAKRAKVRKLFGRTIEPKAA